MMKSVISHVSKRYFMEHSSILVAMKVSSECTVILQSFLLKLANNLTYTYFTGVTNYIHEIGAQHTTEWVIRNGSLAMYQQEACERKFGNLKSSYHKNSNKGGGRRKDNSRRSHTGPMLDKLLLRLFCWSRCASVREFHETHTRKVYDLLNLRWPEEKDDEDGSGSESYSESLSSDSESDSDSESESGSESGSVSENEDKRGSSFILASREFRRRWRPIDEVKV